MINQQYDEAVSQMTSDFKKYRKSKDRGDKVQSKAVQSTSKFQVSLNDGEFS